MLVSVQIPDDFARRFQLDQTPEARPLLEAFVLQRFALGELTSGEVGSVLGLSFCEVEKFLHDHGAPPDTDIEEHLRQMNDIRERIGLE